MKLTRWGIQMAKDVTQSMFKLLTKRLSWGKSKSSLIRENHELRYKVELLKTQNNNLLKKVESIRDENLLLWTYLDEMKEAEKAMMKSINDEIQDSMLRLIEPIGDA